MSKPRVTYFDIAGSRGEEVRLALVLAGVDFDDERLDRAGWAARKAESPWGSLPLLHVPGRGELGQTNAILSYLGRQHGLLPSDPFEAARHEAVLCAGEDVRTAIAATMHLATDEEKRAARAQLAETTLPAFGRRFEAQIEGPFVAGEAIGVADLKLFMVVRWVRSGILDHLPTSVFDDFPKLIGVFEAVGAHPRVRAWYARS